MGLNENLIKIC